MSLHHLWKQVDVFERIFQAFLMRSRNPNLTVMRDRFVGNEKICRYTLSRTKRRQCIDEKSFYSSSALSSCDLAWLVKELVLCILPVFSLGEL